jgi:hypothetical protein
MLYVEKDLAAISKAVFDQWEQKQDKLNHTYLYASNARLTPLDIRSAIEKGMIALVNYSWTKY